MELIVTGNKKTGLAAILALLLLGAGLARATEGAGSSYPVGNEFGYANMLPPGTYNLLYYTNYDGDSVKGVDGNNNRAFRKFRLKANGIAYRLQHVWEAKFLGANIESVVAAPYAVLDVTKVIAQTGADQSDTRNDLSDVLLIPARLAWKAKVLSQSLTVEFAAPMGAYDKNKTVNAGRNYWQYAPCYAVTVRPLPGVETGAKLRYAVNTENKATHYKSGNEFTLEFLAGYRPIPPTAVGIQGYYYKQTTNDELRGKATRPISPMLGGIPYTGTGNKGKVTAIGPYISQAFSKKFLIVLKYQQEFGAENRPRGNRFWFQTLLPF